MTTLMLVWIISGVGADAQADPLSDIDPWEAVGEYTQSILGECEGIALEPHR